MFPLFRAACLLFTSCIFFSCKQKPPVVERSYYCWKSYFEQGMYDYIEATAPQKLYVRFFEVERNSPLQQPIPSVKTRFSLYGKYYRNYMNRDSSLSRICDSMEIIPTVFVRNEIFSGLGENDLDVLADNIWFLIRKYYASYFVSAPFPIREIQIDCDWTVSSKTQYFYLLEKLKALSGKQISCTLRLYPYAYADTMGVPPVDRATLMCYNLVNALENQHQNSILDLQELEAYLRIAGDYPLHLDIALPLYSWGLIYQNKIFTGVLNEPLYVNDEILKSDQPYWLEVQSDTVVGDYFLRPGDQIKYETVSSDMILDAIGLLNEYIDYDDTLTVTLFHLDPDMLSKYDTDTLNHFFDAFMQRN